MLERRSSSLGLDRVTVPPPGSPSTGQGQTWSLGPLPFLPPSGFGYHPPDTHLAQWARLRCEDVSQAPPRRESWSPVATKAWTGGRGPRPGPWQILCDSLWGKRGRDPAPYLDAIPTIFAQCWMLSSHLHSSDKGSFKIKTFWRHLLPSLSPKCILRPFC